MSVGAHRVLYFWHAIGNHFLTFASNMFTDLNLTDMECCYKVFRRDVIQAIELEEDRFGFEPEVVAKVAHMRLRIFEAGLSSLVSLLNINQRILLVKNEILKNIQSKEAVMAMLNRIMAFLIASPSACA
jgi:hypothetical protein